MTTINEIKQLTKVYNYINENLIKDIRKKLIKLLKETDDKKQAVIEITNYLDTADYITLPSVLDQYYTTAFYDKHEIIYFSTMIKYSLENDDTLRDLLDYYKDVISNYAEAVNLFESDIDLFAESNYYIELENLLYKEVADYMIKHEIGSCKFNW